MRPVGTPETFDVHIKLMYDLLALAYKSETTRVATLMYAKDLSPSTLSRERQSRRVPRRVAPCQRPRRTWISSR